MVMQLPDALCIPQWTEGIHFFFFLRKERSLHLLYLKSQLINIVGCQMIWVL